MIHSRVALAAALLMLTSSCAVLDPRSAPLPPVAADPALVTAELPRASLFQRSPRAINLSFSVPVRLQQVNLGDTWRPAERRELEASGLAASVHTIRLPRLSPGRYQLSWVRENGMGGSHNFRVNTPRRHRGHQH